MYQQCIDRMTGFKNESFRLNYPESDLVLLNASGISLVSVIHVQHDLENIRRTQPRVPPTSLGKSASLVQEVFGAPLSSKLPPTVHHCPLITRRMLRLTINILHFATQLLDSSTT